MKDCCRFKIGTCVAETNPQPVENFCKDLKRKDELTVQCKACLKKDRQARKGPMNEYTKKWRIENPEKCKQYARTKNALANARLRKQRYLLKCRYGMTKEDWNVMFEKQNGTCPICLRHSVELKEVLHTDHCHKTKKVRGLLCSTCNKMLGLAKDDLSLLDRAISYLKGGL